MTKTPSVLTSESEASIVAEELAAAYRRMVDWYRKGYGLTREEADRRASEPSPEGYRESILEAPGDQVTWFQLEALLREESETALEVWNRIQSEARTELDTGHRAARVLEGSSNPWERAQFLALRASFLEEWQPTNGIERALIDQMAQTYTAYLYWLKAHITHTKLACKVKDAEQLGEWEPPCLTSAESMEQSAAMVDRFNRLFLRTVRALRDLRRFAPGVTIQNAGQVNIGAQQVNAAQVTTQSNEAAKHDSGG